MLLMLHIKHQLLTIYKKLLGLLSVTVTTPLCKKCKKLLA